MSRREASDRCSDLSHDVGLICIQVVSPFARCMPRRGVTYCRTHLQGERDRDRKRGKGRGRERERGKRERERERERERVRKRKKEREKKRERE